MLQKLFYPFLTKVDLFNISVPLETPRSRTPYLRVPASAISSPTPEYRCIKRKLQGVNNLGVK